MGAPERIVTSLIAPFHRRGVQLGLERIQGALAELGDPQRRFPALQVAGTNGKGSICALLRETLVLAGLRTGLTISPHLVSWCERLQLDHNPIDVTVLASLLREIHPVAHRHSLTPFEAVITAAMVWFARSEVDVAVLEVGLGGRLDATTVHDHRPVLGFATIDLDHQEHLGSTRGAIALEKAGILSPGALAFSAPQHPEVAEALESEAQRIGATLQWVEPLEWPCGLPGGVQQNNAAVARAMLGALKTLGWRIPDELMQRSFQQARWPGRLQPWRWKGCSVILDGAHNLSAASSLRRELGRRGSIPRRWVLGMLANKDGPGMVRELLGPSDQAWIVPVPDHASWSHQALVAQLPDMQAEIHCADSPEEGLLQACVCPEVAARLTRPAATDSEAPRRLRDQPAVVVAGSLYLIGALLGQAGAESGFAGSCL